MFVETFALRDTWEGALFYYWVIIVSVGAAVVVGFLNIVEPESVPVDFAGVALMVLMLLMLLALRAPIDEIVVDEAGIRLRKLRRRRWIPFSSIEEMRVVAVALPQANIFFPRTFGGGRGAAIEITAAGERLRLCPRRPDELLKLLETSGAAVEKTQQSPRASPGMVARNGITLPLVGLGWYLATAVSGVVGPNPLWVHAPYLASLAAAGPFAWSICRWMFQEVEIRQGKLILRGQLGGRREIPVSEVGAAGVGLYPGFLLMPEWTVLLQPADVGRPTLRIGVGWMGKRARKGLIQALSMATGRSDGRNRSSPA